MEEEWQTILRWLTTESAVPESYVAIQIEPNELNRLKFLLKVCRQNFADAQSICQMILANDNGSSPFDLQVSLALEGFYSKQSIEKSIDKLYELSYMTLIQMRRAGLGKSNSDSQTWTKRRAQILLLLTSCLVENGDTLAASTLLDSASELLYDGEDVELISGAGRLFLQVGNIAGAKLKFARVEQLISQLPEVPPRFYDLLMLNRAHTAISMADWLSASTILTSLLSVSPANKIAINNLAVCLVYLGKLREAVTLLDSLHSDCEEIKLNVKTLKELYSV